MNFVTSRLATGATIGDEYSVRYLIEHGITHVINCQQEWCDLVFLKGYGIEYIQCPTIDDGNTKGPEWFGPGIEFALKALAQPHNKVYCHCAAGINRGPSMTFSILLAQGLTPQDARRLIKSARPEVGLAYKHDAEKAVKILGYI